MVFKQGKSNQGAVKKMWMKESEICLQVSRSTGPKKVLNLLDSDGKMKIWKWRCQDIGDDESGLQKINWNIAYMTLMSMMKRKVVFQTTTQGVTEPNPNTQTWGIMTARLNLWFYTVCISKGEEILHSADFTQCVFQNMKSRSHSHSCQGSLCVKSESVGVT